MLLPLCPRYCRKTKTHVNTTAVRKGETLQTHGSSHALRQTKEEKQTPDMRETCLSVLVSTTWGRRQPDGGVRTRYVCTRRSRSILLL